ncbi:MAG TPA: GNAT family protein [Verrucomicrobiae bacterium]|jgi:RimJ/RimL family protein N-acetyltransferase
MSEPLSENPPEDSFFDFACPYCGEVNSFPSAVARTLQECASCGEMIVVPEPGAETAGKVPLPMRTPRLIIRRFQSEDTNRLINLAREDDMGGLPVTEANVDEFIEVQRGAAFTRGEAGAFLAIEVAETHELAGYLLIYFTEPAHSNAGFKLAITPARRRQGFGFEAARAMIDFAFDGLCAHRVTVSCPSRDQAARALLEKLKLRLEGEFIKSWFDGNEWSDVRWYALLKEERSSSGV